MQYDDLSVGCGSGNSVVGAGAAPVEDFSKLSLDQLLQHSNWKARVEGYAKVAKNPNLRKTVFMAVLQKASSESFAASQEAALDAAVRMVPLCTEEELLSIANNFLPLVLDKGITGRPKAVQSGHELTLLLVENGLSEKVFEGLLPVFAHRTPKNRVAALQLCSLLVQEFGMQSFPVSETLRRMEPLFNDVNGRVRKEVMLLCCHCYRFIGGAIKGFLTNLRDVQLQELERQFETVAVGEEPKRCIKGMQNAATVVTASHLGVGSLTKQGTGTNDLDDAAFELTTETPIVSKVPRGFFVRALDKGAKWQDRCDVVNDVLMPLLSAPRFRAKDDYHELSNLMREFLKDPQAPLMLLGFRMIQECARGLRSAFGAYARTFLNPLFDKMKDKKTSVLEHIMKTLEKLIFYHCVTLDQCSEDIDQTSQSKNPSQRLALIHFCTRMVDVLPSNRYEKLGKSIPMLKRMVNDEKSENREAAYGLLSRLMIAFGQPAFQPVVHVMDEKQKLKLSAAMQKSAVRRGGESGLATPKLLPSVVTPSSSPAKKIARVEDRRNVPRPVQVPPSGVVASQLENEEAKMGPCPSDKLHPRSAARTQQSHTAANGVSGTPSMGDAVSMEGSLPSVDEATRVILGSLNGDSTIIELLRSSEWSKRYEGVTRVKSMVDSWSSPLCTKNATSILVFLRATPGLRESILQVWQAILGTYHAVVSNTTSLTPGAGFVVVTGCTPRLTEAKTRNMIRGLLSLVADRLSHRFVISQMTAVAGQIRTPKLLQECNDFFIQLIDQAPLDDEAVDIKHLMGYFQQHCFDHIAPTVKTSTVQVLVALRQKVGPSMDEFMSSAPPAMVSAYENEVAKERRHTGTSLRPPAGSRGDSLNGSGIGPVSRCTADSTDTSAASHLATSQRRVRTTSQSPNRLVPRASASSPVHSSSQQRASTASVSTGLFALSPRDSTSMSTAEVPVSIKPIIRQITHGAGWRDRLEGVRLSEDYIKSCGGSLPSQVVTPLLSTLATRLGESNKNFVVEVLRLISTVVEAGGQAESRPGLRKIAPCAFSMLADQKVILREEAMRAAQLCMSVLGLDAMLPFLQKPLSSDSSVCRQRTLEVMLAGFEQLPPNSNVSRGILQSLIPSVVRALMDRISEVRMAAEQVIGHMFPIVGDEPFWRFVQELKPADQQVVVPVIERQGQLHPSLNSLNATVTTYNDNEEGSRLLTPRPVSSTPTNSVANLTVGEAPFLVSISSLPSPLKRGPPTSKITAARASASMRTGVPLAIPARYRDPNANPAPCPTIPLPTAMADLSGSSSALPAEEREREMYSVQEIIVGLRSAAPGVAINMCTDFMKHFRKGEDCGSPEMIQVMIDRLYDLTTKVDEALSFGLINCLSSMFACSRSAKRCHSSLLFRLLGTMFDCMLSETFCRHENVIKALNSATLKLLEGCLPNDVCSALMSRMMCYSTDYLQSGGRSHLKYIQVTVKCAMRLDLEKVSPENIILCCHEYLLQHPPSAFRNMDDLPIRTVKTILQSTTKRYGGELLDMAGRLVGPQNLVTHFIRACMETHDKAMRAKSDNEQQAVEESKQQQRASQSPPPEYGKRRSIRAVTPVRESKQVHRQGGSGVSPKGLRTKVASSAVGKTAAVNAPVIPGVEPLLSHRPSPSTTTATSASATGSGDAGKVLGLIFSRIRNHITSADGIEELYVYLKGLPAGSSDDDFNYQYNRCSEAFRLYMKRKLERKLSEDTQVPSGFALPKLMMDSK